MPDTYNRPAAPDAPSGLHRGAVGRLSLLGQSVASIGPSIGAAAFFPFAFAMAGNATWISVVIATAAILLVGTCIAYIARHRVSPGALYSYIPAGLRSAAAGYLSGIAGLTLGLAATFACVFGFGIYFDAFLQEANIGHLSSGQIAWIDVLAFLCAAGLSVLEIRISTRALLAVEMSLHDRHNRAAHRSPGPAPRRGNRQSTRSSCRAHGAEHPRYRPRRAVLHPRLRRFRKRRRAKQRSPQAAAQRAAGRRGQRPDRRRILFPQRLRAGSWASRAPDHLLADQAFPLASLGQIYHVEWLATIVALGVAVSFFSCMNAFCWNYAVRMALQISRDGLLPSALGRIHPRTGAPYVASGVAVVLVLAGFAVSVATVSQQTMFQDVSTFNGYLFSLLYLLVCLAAIGWVLQSPHRLVAIIIAGILGAASMGAEFYYSLVPFPAYPASVPLIVFLCVAGMLPPLSSPTAWCGCALSAAAARPLHVQSPADSGAAAGPAGQPDAGPRSSSAAG